MGIKLAQTNVFTALRHVYEHCCSLWCAPCQVSGQFDSETDRPSLPATPGIRQIKKNSETPSLCLSRSRKHRRSRRRAMVCSGRIARAVKWPIGVTRTNGHSRRLRRVSNAWDSTSAAKWLLTLKLVCAEWKITGWLPFKGSFTFPSSCFSRRKFKIQIWNIVDVFPPPCLILLPSRSPSENAQN
jgi:hypothetical protein